MVVASLVILVMRIPMAGSLVLTSLRMHLLQVLSWQDASAAGSLILAFCPPSVVAGFLILAFCSPSVVVASLVAKIAIAGSLFSAYCSVFPVAAGHCRLLRVGSSGGYS